VTARSDVSLEPAADPLIGKTLEQYTVLGKLGGGGMGVVYRAKDAKLGRQVALKFLPPQWSHDETAKQRFIREAQAASATDHPNICTIHDIESTADGQLFIVMAHYEGQTLKERLEAGALPLDQALQIASEVAEGLAKAHTQGVVHRDIKPGNLFLTEDGVRILDFGLAKFADSLQLTIAGTTVGTVAYMSPEQTRGEDADVRSDVWAVGVVLYEMLTGEPPFKGGDAEAISHAIRNDPPPMLRAEEREIPEPVERLVLKALDKNPSERYQTARELARDLRLLRGMSLPVELRTEPIRVPTQTAKTAEASTVAPPSRRWRRRVPAAAALAVAVLAGATVWLFLPVPRTLVAVVPVVNQTGYAELDEYRLALTQTLVSQLAELPNLRVLPYARLLEIVSRWVSNDLDPSSREAIQAITINSGAQVVIVPRLVYENTAWFAFAEFRNPETGTNAGVSETEHVASSLSKSTAYDLMSALAGRIDTHFKSAAPIRVRVSNAIRAVASRQSTSISPPLNSLDAAADLGRGLSAYEELEYAEAHRLVASAAAREPANPLVAAWLAHVAQILQQENDAVQAADQATRLLTPHTLPAAALFVAAVSAESRRDYRAAADRYRELAASRDDPTWWNELGAYHYRRAQWTEAVASYRQTLRLDAQTARPHLELCRLYNRLNELPSAQAEGQRALKKYRDLGNRVGEAQALMCLTDSLRLGTDEQRAEARRNAEGALQILADSGHAYNRARAQYYVALAAETQAKPVEAVTAYEEALATARKAGNVVLEPLVLMNLGAMHVKLGHLSNALEYYRQAQPIWERFGDESRAAQNKVNVAAILIEYAGRSAEGLRDIQNGLGVFRRLGDTHWQIFAAKNIATAYRYSGRHAQAEQELNRAIALVRERDLMSEIAALTVDVALSRYELGQYGAAQDILTRALKDTSGKDATHARIVLGQAHVRLGDFDVARQHLQQAQTDIQRRKDLGQLPQLHEAMGELAYESGHLQEASRQFAEAAALWIDELPEPASVEARARLGLLDALAGEATAGLAKVRLALEHSRRIGLLALEARCRVIAARIGALEGRFQEASAVLDSIVPDGETAIGPELQAQARYWRAQALIGRREHARAEVEISEAHRLVESVRVSLPDPYRRSYASRPDIQTIMK